MFDLNALTIFENDELLTKQLLDLYRSLGKEFETLEQEAKKHFSPIWNRFIIPKIRKYPEGEMAIYFSGVNLEIRKVKKWEYVLFFNNEGNTPSITFLWKGSRFTVIDVCGNKGQLAALIKIFCDKAKNGDFEIKT